MMLKSALRSALGIGLTLAALAAAASAEQRTAPVFRSDVRPGRTVVTVQPADLAQSSAELGSVWRQTAVLPPDAASWRVEVDGAPVEARLLGRLRGLPVLTWLVEDGAAGATAVVEHDGAWNAGARRASAGFDAALSAALPGWTVDAAGADHGTYLVITAPAYAAAVQPLVDWKRQKGLTVRVATTEETGETNAAIQAWLRDAYATWELPPEYVLLVGDVDVLPSWFFSANVTDLPYAHMDTDDWLPDLLLGRWPVANAAEAAAIAAKTVAYEKAPYRGDEGWFTRQLMVGGNYGSETPSHTVRWVGEQLETLGFDAATEVFFPPFWNGVAPITQTLQSGVGMCVYRGWAYGTAGWEPPHFTVAEIPNVETGAMTPVVMSFVCLNGDFAGDDPCFGEVFLRQGTPEAPKGAVAFIGNGEHWSHTRYNDAMAISYFEMFPDPAIRDLGQLALAGRLRFMAYFPHELSAAEFGEESVEFYFHIYNLLGDPELNVWKGAPADLDVTYGASLPGAAGRLDVTVREDDGLTAVPGALVGVTADGALVGRAVAGADGLAVVLLDGWNGTADLTVTVTAADRFAHTGTVSAGTPASFVAVSAAGADAAPGGVVSPGAAVTLHPTLANAGASAAGSTALTLGVRGPATVSDAALTVAGVPAGGAYVCVGDESVAVTVDQDARDGDVVELLFQAAHDAALDASAVVWTVSAPDLRLASLLPDGDGVAEPGETSELTLTLTNGGGAATAGGSVAVELLTAGVGALTGGPLTLAALAPGADAAAAGGLSLSLDAAVPVGTGVTLRVTTTTSEGATFMETVSLTAGHVDAGAPVGPDAYGYRALDSADLDYPALAPAYRWTELDTALGGAGQPLTYNSDNYDVVLVDLPFSFTYYGTSYSRARVSENGWISFDLSDEFEFYNWPLPNTHGNASMIAPFWDNFDPTLPGTGGVFTHHDAAAGTFTVEWSSMRHYRPEVTDAQTFQLVLFDPAVHATASGDGNILFLYRQVADTDDLRQYATVGLEDAAETDGLQLSYANLRTAGMAPLGPGLAVLLTTEAPVRVPYQADAFTARRGPAGVELAWTVSDARPVVGWRLVRLTADGAETATPDLLPADARAWTDPAAPEDPALTYRLEAVHPYAHVNRAAVAAVETGVAVRPTALLLEPLRPNPSRGRTELAFALPAAAPASLRVYDAAGRLVRTLLAGEIPSGPGQTVWDGRREDGRDAGAGVYFFRLESGGEVRTRKLLLVR
ncbi:MAG TPA: C25 family cysteine peptidase [Candidatus Krumholzibacteria bacterium]|nr:C25 family cysteine peptidase [Candidatus Krumholzibacteria bacterium]